MKKTNLTGRLVLILYYASYGQGTAQPASQIGEEILDSFRIK